MASTYSNLKIQLMGTGENSGTWGTVTNVNLGTALEEAITGSADVTFASTTVTLTLTDSNASQTARNLRLNLTGTSGGAQNLIVPAIEKVYIVNNGCADAITVKNSSGSGIAVPAGKTMWVYNTGSNVVDAVTHLSSLTLGTALPIASGGTGSNSATFSGANITALNATSVSSGTLAVARGGTGVSTSTGTGSTVLSASPALTGTPTAPTATLGTNTTQIATTAFALANGIPSGAIVLWSGSVASIPSGWLLCNGSSGTPDLRNRFVVGAGSTYAVAATGGSADAIVVSHNHSATSTSVVTDPGHFHSGDQSVSSGSIGAYYSGGSASIHNTTTSTTGITVATTTTTASTGSSGTNANLPPYYALAYIMKA
jgi:hypothetical protein